jgi:hypothetical protein
MKNKLKWLDTEYCDRADETIQPVLVNDTLLYTLFDRRGYNYVFETIYAVHLFFSGFDKTYSFTCETEEELVEYLENYKP